MREPNKLYYNGPGEVILFSSQLPIWKSLDVWNMGYPRIEFTGKPPWAISANFWPHTWVTI